MAAVSRVVVESVVRCPFSVAHDYAADFLSDAERSIAVHVPLRDFIVALRGRLSRPVRLTFAVHPDDTEAGRTHDAMLIEWQAGTRLFPQFHGTVRLRIASVDATALRLEGAYRPPLGLLGRAFDAAIGRHIARATMRDLLARLGASLEEREAAYRAGVLGSKAVS
ncbi:MAG: hypothetical protein JOZ24_07450 [Candidatus Eremiobacteraeota bacterium]|nr:hypothetical protein [Candidatus Eremiobacteraeota bacterium]